VSDSVNFGRKMSGGHDPRELARRSAETRRLKRQQADAENAILAKAEAQLAFADPDDISTMVLQGLIKEARSSSSATARVQAYKALHEAFPMRDRQREREAEEERAGPLKLEPGQHATSLGDVIDLALKVGVNPWSTGARDARHDAGAARQLVNDANRHAELLFVRVDAMRRARVWQPLGYDDWTTFCQAELGGTPSTAGGTGRAGDDRPRALSGTPPVAHNSHSESADPGDADAGGLARFRRAMLRAFQ
jgi:hypothetical protein